MPSHLTLPKEVLLGPMMQTEISLLLVHRKDTACVTSLWMLQQITPNLAAQTTQMYYRGVL